MGGPPATWQSGFRNSPGRFCFPAAFPAAYRQSARARSTKAASWATRSAMRSAMLYNPNLAVACVISDGEAETGPLTSDKGIYLKQQLKDKLIEHK